MNGGKSRERRLCLHRAIIGYDWLWLDVIGSCDKSRLLFSCELSVWMKKMMALLTNYKVSKQVSRLDITALCRIKIKYEMAWKCDDCQFLVSIQLDEMKNVSSCMWQCLWQGFYDDDPKICWLLKRTAEHQFTNKKQSVYYLQVQIGRLVGKGYLH